MIHRTFAGGLDSLAVEALGASVIYVKPLSVAWRTMPGVTLAEVLVRTHGDLLVAQGSLADIEQWADRLPETQARHVLVQIDRLRTPPGMFAGLDLSEPRVMGIINATPDSFSDGGTALEPGDAIWQGRTMLEAGAAILDVGGESTRPGAFPVDADEECRRVLPVIENLAARGAIVSIDSRKADVVQPALEAGAAIVNDISALAHDPRTMDVVAASGVPVILMHALSDPRTMQDSPAYDHVSLDIHDYLEERITTCVRAGIARENIAVDPGIGFGKTMEHNFTLLRDLALFHSLGCPILLGASRKSFIGRVSGEEVPSKRRGGSVSAALVGVHAGVQLLRVHDVADTVQAVKIWCRTGKPAST